VPAPSERWWQALNSEDGTKSTTGRGRCTRNFIVQGTAAEWALVLLALLRRALHERGLGELVFFLHDEVVVHCPEAHAAAVCAAIEQTAESATRTLFGDMPVRIPLRPKGSTATPKRNKGPDLPVQPSRPRIDQASVSVTSAAFT
jgi:DNA polymerase I